jgi:putative aldouronate transport system substrate-binding protein
MKRTTRLLALLLALAMVTCLMSACGSGSSTTTTETETSESAAAETTTETAATEAAATEDASADDAAAAATGSTEGQYEAGVWPAEPLGNVALPLTDTPETFTMWMGVNPNVLAIIDDPTEDCALWSELAERTGVYLEWHTVHPDSELEQFNLMCAGGDLYDILSNATTLYTGGGEAGVAEEILLDIRPLLTEELAPQIYAIINSDQDLYDSLLTESGYIAGLPCVPMQKETDPTFGPIIRQDWLDDLGLDTPETLDELHDVLVAFRDEKGADAALTIQNYGVGLDNGLVSAYGILGSVGDGTGISDPMYQIDGTVYYGPIQDEFKEYLKTIHQWYEEGLIWQDFMTYSDTQNPPTDIILSGECGVFYGEVTFIATLENSATDENFKLSGVQNFVLEEGGTIPFADDVTWSAATPWSISTACDNPELLIQWCNYLYTDDGALLANYGVENESFVFDENGSPVFTDVVLNNPDYTTTVALFMYVLDRGPFYRDETREQSGYTAAQKEAGTLWHANYVEGRSMGSYALTSAENEEIKDRYADIKTHASEMILKFIVGTADIDTEWDSYVQAIKDFGIDDILEVYQGAYDRYLAGDQVEEETSADPGPPPDDAPAP